MDGEGWDSMPVGDDDGDNVITITKTDGGTGDADGTENGTITDPAGIGAPYQQKPESIPTLNEWGMIILSLLLFGVVVLKMRRKIVV